MIPYGRQSINEEDIAAVVSALKSDWLTTGPLVEAFESALEEVVGASCIAVSSGTAALHCAYAAIGLQHGDEVITPPITFIATQATAALFGAKIVFADVQSDTANIDPGSVETLITPRTKAIVAVDYAGHPAELDELRMIADRYGIYLIEDAAHSIGSIYKGRSVGSIADITTFSFFPTKNLTTGEGGAVSSIHPDLLEKAKRFSRQGLVRDPREFVIRNQGLWHQEVHEFGLNYRLPDILCALGISQLKRLNNFKGDRSKAFDNYSRALMGIKGLEVPVKRDYVDPMWHLYPIKVPQNCRKEVYNELRKEGFLVQVNYLPVNRHPVFISQGYSPSDTPEASEFYGREISLPMMANPEVLDDQFFSRISEVLANSLASNRTVDKSSRVVISSDSNGNENKIFSNHPKVLVTSSSHKVPLIRAVQKVARELNPNIKVVSGDVNKNVVSKYFSDFFWEMPKLEASSLQDIIDFCLKAKVGLILPTRDGELEYWAKHRLTLEDRGIKVIVSNIDTVKKCLDKLKFYEFAREFGFNSIPTTNHIYTLTSQNLFVVKERFGSGSVNIGIGLNQEEAIRYAKNLENPVFQPYIQGREISADIYLIPGVHESVVLRNRTLVVAGESQITQIFRDADLEELMLSLAKKLGIIGPAVIQAMIDKFGNANIIECNPRIGGASTASNAAGSNIFRHMILYFLLDQPDEGSGKIDRIRELVQVRTQVDEYFYDLDL